MIIETSDYSEIRFVEPNPSSDHHSGRSPSSVPRLDEEALDALTFGVIELDRDGIVRRYNLAESRFARVDRATVLGRTFFRDVAPCTQTPEFEGRIREFFETSPHERDEVTRFTYLFDFKFGAQQVMVEIVKTPDPDRVCLCVNRVQFDDVRPDAPPGWPAPLQSDLAPNERRLGVFRDEQEQRYVRVQAPFFRSLHQTWLKLAPRGWRVFSREWGRVWGLRSVVELETSSLESYAKSVRELPMKTMLSLVQDWSRDQGWGELHPDPTAARQGAFVVGLERSALAEAVGQTGERGCALLEGWLGAVFSHLAGRKLTAREVGCACRGDGQCSFVIVSDDREDDLDTAALGVYDAQLVLERLRKGRSA